MADQLLDRYCPVCGCRVQTRTKDNGKGTIVFAEHSDDHIRACEGSGLPVHDPVVAALGMVYECAALNYLPALSRAGFDLSDALSERLARLK
jgi:hypothetical protein